MGDGDIEFGPDLLHRKAFTTCGIAFDNADGIGSVPNMADIFWKGVFVEMTPKTFLSLAAPLEDDLREGTVRFLDRNVSPIGSPYLCLRAPEDGHLSKVVGHEGRHRMSEIAKRVGYDVPIPIGLFVYDRHYMLKAREIDSELVSEISIGAIREKSREYVSGTLFETAVWSHGILGLVESPSRPVDRGLPLR